MHPATGEYARSSLAPEVSNIKKELRKIHHPKNEKSTHDIRGGSLCNNNVDNAKKCPARDEGSQIASLPSSAQDESDSETEDYAATPPTLSLSTPSMPQDSQSSLVDQRVNDGCENDNRDDVDDDENNEGEDDSYCSDNGEAEDPLHIVERLFTLYFSIDDDQDSQATNPLFDDRLVSLRFRVVDLNGVPYLLNYEVLDWLRQCGIGAVTRKPNKMPIKKCPEFVAKVEAQRRHQILGSKGRATCKVRNLKNPPEHLRSYHKEVRCLDAKWVYDAIISLLNKRQQNHQSLMQTPAISKKMYPAFFVLYQLIRDDPPLQGEYYMTYESDVNPSVRRNPDYVGETPFMKNVEICCSRDNEEKGWVWLRSKTVLPSTDSTAPANAGSLPFPSLVSRNPKPNLQEALSRKRKTPAVSHEQEDERSLVNKRRKTGAHLETPSPPPPLQNPQNAPVRCVDRTNTQHVESRGDSIDTHDGKLIRMNSSSTPTLQSPPSLSESPNPLRGSPEHRSLPVKKRLSQEPRQEDPAQISQQESLTSREKSIASLKTKITQIYEYSTVGILQEETNDLIANLRKMLAEHISVYGHLPNDIKECVRKYVAPMYKGMAERKDLMSHMIRTCFSCSTTFIESPPRGMDQFTEFCQI